MCYSFPTSVPAQHNSDYQDEMVNSLTMHEILIINAVQTNVNSVGFQDKMCDRAVCLKGIMARVIVRVRTTFFLVSLCFLNHEKTNLIRS